MPAKSKDQQRAAGFALQAKRDNKVDELPDGAAKNMAKSMSEKELEKLANTKRKGLPKDLPESENREWAGISLVEVFKEEMLGVSTEDDEEEQIASQKSKTERLEDREIGTGKEVEDMWTSTAGGTSPALASHSRGPMSSNTTGARVAEERSFRTDWDEDEYYDDHDAAGASEELGSRRERKMIDWLIDDAERLNIAPSEQYEDVDDLLFDVFGHYPTDNEEREEAEVAIRKAQELWKKAPKISESSLKTRWQHLAGILQENAENAPPKVTWYVEEYHPIYGSQIVADNISTEEEAEKMAEELANDDSSGWFNYTIGKDELHENKNMIEKSTLKEMDDAQLKRYVKRLAQHKWAWEEVVQQLKNQYGVSSFDIKNLQSTFQDEAEKLKTESVKVTKAFKPKKTVNENDLSILFEDE